MSTSFQYRLQQYESTPPDESWQVISKRLGEEFQTTESLLSAKLTGFFQEPPTDLWSAINTRLPAMESDSDLQDFAVHSGWPAGDRPDRPEPDTPAGSRGRATGRTKYRCRPADPGGRAETP